MNTKRIFILLVLITISALAFSHQSHAQQTRSIGYQAMIRKADGSLLTNTTVTVQITLNQASADGTQLYAESHEVQTSPAGLISLEIGSKDPQTFNAINWATADAWLNVEVTATGKDPVDIKMTQKLQAVPYALHAETVADLENKADKTVVETLVQDISEIKGKVTENANAIANNTGNSALKDSLKNFKTKISEIEGKVTENANAIANNTGNSALKDSLKNFKTKISEIEGKVTENANAIANKADKSAMEDSIKNFKLKVSELEGKIIEATNAIANKADKSALQDSIKNIKTKISELESKVTENAKSITNKADKSEVEKLANEINKKISELEGKINKNDKEIKQLLKDLQQELKFIKALPTVKKELEEAQAAARESAIAAFNSKPANVTTHYVNDTLDNYYSESVYGIVSGGYEITNPKKGPVRGSYTGKMKLEFAEDPDGYLKMEMTQNAMGLNELALYSIIWCSLGFWTIKCPEINHYLNMCVFEEAGITLEDLCEILDWKKEPGKVGELNLKIHDIKVYPPDENNISQINYMGKYRDLYNYEYLGIAFDFDYSPYNRMVAIWKDPTHKYHEIVEKLRLDNFEMEWWNYTPWPQLYFGNIDFENLLDFEPVPFVDESEQITDISQITGQIDWNKKEITCRFPTAIEQGGIVYVDVKINADV